jgi:hypothetical protein
MWSQLYFYELNFTKPRLEALVREGVIHGSFYRAFTTFNLLGKIFK